jgi:predicted DNA-binding transcriptional regulator AlpA
MHTHRERATVAGPLRDCGKGLGTAPIHADHASTERPKLCKIRVAGSAKHRHLRVRVDVLAVPTPRGPETAISRITSLGRRSMATEAKLAYIPPRSAMAREQGSRLLRAEEVAEVTRLSIETLAQWRSQRRGIPFVKISRNCVRYRQTDLDSWLAERTVLTDQHGSGRR